MGCADVLTVEVSVEQDVAEEQRPQEEHNRQHRQQQRARSAQGPTLDQWLQGSRPPHPV
jgi:hypothetical protein